MSKEMDVVFVVKVRDWGENYALLNFSIHKTKAGAEECLKKARTEYQTTNAHIDEVELQP
jgi:hypothetical protein